MLNLYIFNRITEDEVISSLLKYKKSLDENDYYIAARGLIAFAPQRLTDGSIIREYVLRTMLEQEQLPDITELRNFLRHDVKTIYTELLAYDWDGLFAENGLLPLSNIGIPKTSTGLGGYIASLEAMLSCESNEALGGALLAHAESFGTGCVSAYSVLKWENGALAGVLQPDDITFDDLIGLEHQKAVLIENTRSFILGSLASDILLTGCDGTGKTSVVRACLNMFKNNGLRLIELNKSDLSDLTKLIGCIKNDVLKYIIFIDDLSFDDNDTYCEILKAVLDRQAETDSRRILIYAECRDAEFCPLSARFGINLNFTPPTQSEYLQIVEALLKAYDIEMTEELRAAALERQADCNGFSGRAARQFALSVLGQS